MSLSVCLCREQVGYHLVSHHDGGSGSNGGHHDGGDGGGGHHPNWMLAALTVLAWVVLAVLIVGVPLIRDVLIPAVTR